MEKYACRVCGNVYDPLKGDPENGVVARTDFEDIPETWRCSVCKGSQEFYDKME